MADGNYFGGLPEGSNIQYGNQIALKHNMTGRIISSQDGISYEGGSGQQMVVANAWEASQETFYIVLPPLGEERDGEDVNFGDVIRLKHLETRRNLHSHDFPSPVTEQQEVTCWGGDDESDENDEWILEQWSFDEAENEEFSVEDTTWYVGRSFFLRHRPTGNTLHSHDEFISDEVAEVTCYGAGPDENDRWRAVV